MRIAAVVMNMMMMMIRITAHCDILAVADIIIAVDRSIVTAAAVTVVHHEGDAGKALLFGGGVFHRSGFVLFRDE